MANIINTEGLATGLCEEAVRTFELIKDKLPDIRDFDKTPEKLLNLQGENADVIGALFKNSIAEAEYVCRNGRAITACVAELGKVNIKIGFAIGLGLTAVVASAYCCDKIKQHDRRFDALEKRMQDLEGKTGELDAKTNAAMFGR